MTCQGRPGRTSVRDGGRAEKLLQGPDEAALEDRR